MVDVAARTLVPAKGTTKATTARALNPTFHRRRRHLRAIMSLEPSSTARSYGLANSVNCRSILAGCPLASARTCGWHAIARCGVAPVSSQGRATHRLRPCCALTRLEVGLSSA